MFPVNFDHCSSAKEECCKNRNLICSWFPGRTARTEPIMDSREFSIEDGWSDDKVFNGHGRKQPFRIPSLLPRPWWSLLQACMTSVADCCFYSTDVGLASVTLESSDEKNSSFELQMGRETIHCGLRYVHPASSQHLRLNVLGKKQQKQALLQSLLSVMWITG